MVTQSRERRRLVLLLVALGVVLAVGAVAGCLAAGWDWQRMLDSYELPNLVLGVSFLACGTVIAWWVPRNAVGWLLTAAGLCHLTTAAFVMASVLTAWSGWPPILSRLAATIAIPVWQIGAPGLFPLAILLFPTGRLPSRRWLPVAVVLVAAAVLQPLPSVFAPSRFDEHYSATESLLALPKALPDEIETVLGMISSVAALVAILSLVLRYVRGDERTRRQLLWVLLAVLIILALNVQRDWTGDGPIPLLLIFVLLPAALAVAIVRHRLLDIRLVLARSILYGLLVAVVIAAYAGIVAGLSALLPDGTDRAVAVGAALVVAIAFDPLRRLLLRTVGRALFGARSDPARAAVRLEEDLAGAGRDLSGVLERLRTELRFPALAVEDAAGEVLARSGGFDDGVPPAALPLVFDGARQGRLLVRLRPGERVLHDDDRRVLALLSAPLAVMLHALALSDEITAARIRVVEEREQERSRLQRELHDGLGPVLTSAAYRLDAASNLAAQPERAQPLLAEARADLRAAIASVREVVHGLRPIELEESGLRAALDERLRSFTCTDRPAVELSMPEELPDLSPAVELAAYRIVMEAVTNAVRHSTAHRCTVTVSATGEAIELRIDDDGQPEADWVPGTGLRSMRHRAEEVGGTLAAGAGGPGWSVSALLPVA